MNRDDRATGRQSVARLFSRPLADPPERRVRAASRLAAAGYPAAFFAVLALLSASPTAQIGIGGGLRLNSPARTLKDLRDADLIRQRFDFSCGAAALATILRYGFDEPVTEADLLQQLFGLLADDEMDAVRRTGFSLLHLQRVAQARGYDAQGFRLAPDQLSRLGGPVIVFIEPRGYAHFAVLRGVKGDRVYLADPSRGNVRMPSYEFTNTWLQDDGLGIIFAVEPAAGRPAGAMRLALRDEETARPEQMTVVELLTVGGSLMRPDSVPR